MGNKRGCACFIGCSLQIVCEISAKWCDTHCSTIPHRTLSAEGVRCTLTPIAATIDLVKLRARHTAISTIRFALVTPRETPGQCVLMHIAVKFESLDN